MSDDPTRAAEERAAEYAERAGRMSYFVNELAALAAVRDEVPAGFLRERLALFAAQATDADLVRAERVDERVAYLRERAEYWRRTHGKGRA